MFKTVRYAQEVCEGNFTGCGLRKMLDAKSSWATIFTVEYIAEICEKKKEMCQKKKWKQFVFFINQRAGGSVAHSFHFSCALIFNSRTFIILTLFT